MWPDRRHLLKARALNLEELRASGEDVQALVREAGTQLRAFAAGDTGSAIENVLESIRGRVTIVQQRTKELERQFVEEGSSEPKIESLDRVVVRPVDDRERCPFHYGKEPVDCR